MPERIVPTEDQTNTVSQLLDHLYRVRDELMLVDPRSLKPTQHIKWNEQIYQTGLAISAAQKVLLSGITQEFAYKLASIEQSTKDLARALYSLKKANEIIQAVSGTLNVIKSIVELLS